jgi:hypothetical protein
MNFSGIGVVEGPPENALLAEKRGCRTLTGPAGDREANGRQPHFTTAFGSACRGLES